MKAGWPAGTRAFFPSPKRCPTSFSTGERRSYQAVRAAGGIFSLLVLISCSYSSKSPVKESPSPVPCTDLGSLGRLQGLMLGKAPARLQGRRAGLVGSSPSSPHRGIPPWLPARAASPHLPSPPRPQPTGCSGARKGGCERSHRALT